MIRTVLFDLDGTILDTNELILASFLHALQGVTPVEYTREMLIPHMGRPLFDQFRNFTGRTDVDDLVKIYREYNISRHDELVKEFPQVKDTLAELDQLGIDMGVVTSKIRLTTEMGLKLCGLDTFMKSVVTVDEVQKAKPDPEGIHKAMKAIGADPQTTIMVGDSHYDIEAAQNAGIRSVAVAWSLKGEQYLKSYKPDYFIHSMPELLELVKQERS